MCCRYDFGPSGVQYIELNQSKLAENGKKIA
jgi:hypothetical protein